MMFVFPGEDNFIRVYGFHIHYLFEDRMEFENRGYKMSLEAVIEYFSEYNMDHRVMVLEKSTATLEEASQAHGVDPDQIGKTLPFKFNGEPILIAPVA